MGKWPSKGAWDGTQWACAAATAPQVEQDVGCLLSMLMVRLRLGTPKINTFSGDATPGKTEVFLNNGTMRYSVLETITESQ